MSANIFINYRKDDSRWNTQALYNELLKYFPKESIFKDFNTIGLGDDYVVSINKALEQCDVLLVIIGKHWLEMKNKNGLNRLSDPGDLVRIEIATALKRNIKVIPVLFDDTKMFFEHDLPEELQALTRRQSISVDDTKFDADVEKLAAAINKILGKNQDPTTPKVNPAKAEVTLKDRLRSALIVSIIAFLISGVGVFLNMARRQQSDISEQFKSAAILGGIAFLIWFAVGLVTGPDKKKLLWAVISSLVAFAVFLVVDSHQNFKTINQGIAFVMPVAGLLFSLVHLMIRRLNTQN